MMAIQLFYKCQSMLMESIKSEIQDQEVGFIYWKICELWVQLGVVYM